MAGEGGISDMKNYADEARASGCSACKEITYLNYVSSITSGSRIEAESAGRQIAWKEPAPPISKTVRSSSEREYGSGVVLCKGAKLQAASR